MLEDKLNFLQVSEYYYCYYLLLLLLLLLLLPPTPPMSVAAADNDTTAVTMNYNSARLVKISVVRIYVIRTKLMHYLSSVYFICWLSVGRVPSQPRRQTVKTEKHNTYQLLCVCVYIYIVYLLMMGYKYAWNM
jgi:hypothetical protein